jgi:hypothetical protein
MKQVKAKYVLGLTATPTRKDGHYPIIFHAVRPDPVQSQRARCRGALAFSAPGDAEIYCLPHAGKHG